MDLKALSKDFRCMNLSPFRVFFVCKDEESEYWYRCFEYLSRKPVFEAVFCGFGDALNIDTENIIMVFGENRIFYSIEVLYSNFTFLMYADFVLCRAFDDAKNISSVDLAVPDNRIDDVLRYKLLLLDCFRFRKLITLYPGPL